MSTLKDTAAAKLGEHTITVNDLLFNLKLSRQFGVLVSAVRPSAVRRLAADRGVKVSAAELQEAADQFRRDHRLSSAAATKKWLARHELTVDDFERLAEDMALEWKLAKAVLGDRVTEYVRANKELIEGRESGAAVRQQIGKALFDAWLAKQLADRGFQWLLGNAVVAS